MSPKKGLTRVGRLNSKISNQYEYAVYFILVNSTSKCFGVEYFLINDYYYIPNLFCLYVFIL